MSQVAVILQAGVRKAIEVSVPQPSGEPGDLAPQSFSKFLPGSDPDHLLVADCPFSLLTGKRVVIVYDASPTNGISNPRPANLSASLLTTNIESGLQIEIKGDALVLYTSHGAGFGIQEWSELDNVIYDELMEFFGQGLRPAKSDVDRLVADFKAGKFQYRAITGDDDAHKVDGDIKLPGWG